jgi:RimJ/RimL family protein N-acetyltransferase
MELDISPLRIADSVKVSQMLLSARPEYCRYFTPFSFDVKSFRHVLQSAKRDRYWRIRFAEEIAGFFMLRGFDSGYERPSFGVFIAEKFSNKGLSTLALQYSLSWCKLNNVSKVMLKVHPDNVYARRAYEGAGFELMEVLADTGQLLFEKRLR